MLAVGDLDVRGQVANSRERLSRCANHATARRRRGVTVALRKTEQREPRLRLEAGATRFAVRRLGLVEFAA